MRQWRGWIRVLGLVGCFWGAAACGPAIAAAGEQPAIRLIVSPAGNDHWSGRLEAPAADGQDGPLATLAGARDALRALKAQGPLAGPVQVLLREGVYPLTETLVFDPRDSGSVAAPITYAAWPGETAILSGGRRLTGWQAGEGGVWRAPAGGLSFGALWAGDAWRTPARIPNEGSLRTAGPIEETPDPGMDPGKHAAGFRFNPGDLRPFSNQPDVLVVTMHSWDTTHFRIAQVDEAAQVVQFTAAPVWAFGKWERQQRYYLENAREGLDQPGEWCLDRQRDTVEYLPRPGESPAQTVLIAPVLQQLIRLQGDLTSGSMVEFLRFEGLGFRHTHFPLGPEGYNNHQSAITVDAAFEAEGARFCSIVQCEFTDLGNYAIALGEGCQDNWIERNHLHALGGGGVKIGSERDAPDAQHTTGRNTVFNNWIHDGGRIFPPAIGVWIGRSSDNRVAHNEISDFFYTGVSVGWSWGYAPSSANHNLIEYNHIHDLGKDVLSDMGGIYTLGIAPGTILRNNHIHDIAAYAYGGWGIYPDEGSTDLLIENNLVYRTEYAGFHQHYGRENRVRNNIFAFSRHGALQRSREEDHCSFYFERNIVLSDNGQMLDSNWGNGQYWLNRNCYWNLGGAGDFKGQPFEQWRQAGRDPQSLWADPQFADAAGLDFTLAADSPALALGFVPFDGHAAGLTGDPAWMAAPAAAARGMETP